MDGRILIVDDDKVLCEELADYFSEAGFQVEHFQLPEEGLAQLKQNHYDVLLLDYKMPQFDGIEFLKRSADCRATVKTFLISGSLAVVQMLKDQGLYSSLAGTLSKPFDLSTLHAAIKTAIRPSP